jgi:predicted nuclease with RNAse H fold
MRTAGVDLSSQDKKSAACVVEWSRGRASIVSLKVDVGDVEITRLIGEVDKLGIDVPLGWPIAFAEAVWRHSEHGTWPATYKHANMEAYRYRRTDIHVWMTGGLAPLSVSTDRIGIPAMRSAALLAAVEPRVALDGSGVVVEVYPAAALRRWGLPWRQYKGSEHAAERNALVSSFTEATAAWLSLEGAERIACESSDDAFDALIAALVARAAAVGTVEPIPEEDHSAALREGWIALPREQSLRDLGIPRESTP